MGEQERGAGELQGSKKGGAGGALATMFLCVMVLALDFHRCMRAASLSMLLHRLCQLLLHIFSQMQHELWHQWSVF